MARLVIAWLVLAGAASAQSLGREVNEAIARGRDALLAHQRPDGSFGHFGRNEGFFHQYPMGYTALAVYVLRKTGVPGDDPVVERALTFLRGVPFTKVYGTACLVLAQEAIGDPELRPWMFEAADWLADQFDEPTKLWGYPGGGPELSNTQFAVMALGIAARHGHPVRDDLWEQVVEGTLTRQNEDGGYFYRSGYWPFSSGTMTCAGLTTLMIALDALERTGGVSSLLRRDAERSMERAWAWMDRNFTTAGTPRGALGDLVDRFPEFGRHDFCHYYFLYGVERVASLAQRQHVAGLDWYADGAREILAHQTDEGHWGQFEASCFALLFLKRVTISGRAPSGADEGEDLPDEATTGPGHDRSAPLPVDDAAAPWAFTTEEPRRGWNRPAFDDERWPRAPAPFGAAGTNTPAGPVRTPWETTDLWIRRPFTWQGPVPDALTLWVLHDDVATVWIDGVEACHGPTWSVGRYNAYEVSRKALARLGPGEHLLAAHCRDTGGGRSLDVRLERPGVAADRLSAHWHESRPRGGVPWISTWWTRSPERDEDDLLLLDAPGPPGAEDAGWSAAHSRDGTLRWEGGRRPQVVWVSTWLHAREPVSGWLWFGSGGGLRAWLDERVLLSHHEHRDQQPDQDRVFLDLPAGSHRLSVLVEVPEGGGALSVRACDRRGRTLPGLWPDLEATEPDRSRVARTHPGAFALEALAEQLTPPAAKALRFDDEQSLDAFAVRGASAGSPLWRPRAPEKHDPFAPHPGRRGWIRLVPGDQGVPVQLIWRLTPESAAGGLTVDVSADTVEGAADTLVRVGLHGADGLRWVAEHTLAGGGPARRRGWVALSVPAWEPATLAVLEVVGPGAVFVDAVSAAKR